MSALTVDATLPRRTSWGSLLASVTSVAVIVAALGSSLTSLQQADVALVRPQAATAPSASLSLADGPVATSVGTGAAPAFLTVTDAPERVQVRVVPQAAVPSGTLEVTSCSRAWRADGTCGGSVSTVVPTAPVQALAEGVAVPADGPAHLKVVLTSPGSLVLEPAAP